jgi:hypothetical protein
MPKLEKLGLCSDIDRTFSNIAPVYRGLPVYWLSSSDEKIPVPIPIHFQFEPSAICRHLAANGVPRR